MASVERLEAIQNFYRFLLYEPIDTEKPIDWYFIERFAKSLTSIQRISEADRLALELWYTDEINKLSPYISDFTKLRVDKKPTIRVVDPIGWIDFSLENFRFLFDSLDEEYKKLIEKANKLDLSYQGGGYPQMPFGMQKSIEKIPSLQIGAIIGSLSSLVLGQYDQGLFGRNPLTESLYFVDPNISGMSSRLNCEFNDFRRWIGIHEETHHYEFDNQLSVGWLKGWFNSETQNMMKQSLKQRSEILDGAPQEGGNKEISGDDLMELFRPTIDMPNESIKWIQAVMCVIEGYSDFVMDRVGSQIIPNYELIKRNLAEFKAEIESNKNMFDRLAEQFMGLDLKRQQYTLGKFFVEHVIDQEGIVFMNKFYEKQDNLPTMEEIKNPSIWIQRIKLSK